MKTPSKSRRQKQLTKTAYHEAGHAVALWELKFKIKKATIVPKGNTAGA
jgi:ATP-dependent Zn protease